MLLKEVQVVHPRVLGQILDFLLEGIHLVQVGDHHLMDLVSKLILRQLANWGDHSLGEGVIDLLLVVVYGELGVLQVLDVVEHV